MRVPLSKSSEKDATAGEHVSPMTAPAPTALVEGIGIAVLPLRSSTTVANTEMKMSAGELLAFLLIWVIQQSSLCTCPLLLAYLST